MQRPPLTASAEVAAAAAHGPDVDRLRHAPAARQEDAARADGPDRLANGPDEHASDPATSGGLRSPIFIAEDANEDLAAIPPPARTPSKTTPGAAAGNSSNQLAT